MNVNVNEDSNWFVCFTKVQCTKWIDCIDKNKIE